MNLNFAAQFLDESIYLTEDADSKGRDQTIKWLKNNYNIDSMGIGANDDAINDNDEPITFSRVGYRGAVTGPNPEYIFRRAEEYFAHPLNQGLSDFRKGVKAYLPGATRIAITECGWLTKNVNEKMMENLRYIYAALFFDYYDKRGPYTRDAEDRLVAAHPGYAGLCNYDFDGRTYDELMADFGSMIPEAKRRLEEQLHGAAMTGVNGNEETGPAQRYAGQYHIEYIPDFRTSHEWYDYTNPLRNDYDGCHWCITHKESYWRDYKNKHNGQVTIYFCWKAESKEALKAMNDHILDYCPADAPHDEIMKAPFNEYGLSLISIMVYPDSNGDPVFMQATSRYNHVGPDKEIYGAPYSDHLVPQGDKAAICRILGITEDEFDSSFPVRSGGGDTADHSDLVRNVTRLKSENKIKEIFRTLDVNGVSREGFAARENNLIKFKDQNEFNLVTHEGIIVSPGEWFSYIKQIASNIAAVKRITNSKINFITGSGKYLLPRDVWNYKVLNNEIDPNYALVEVKRKLWNVLNLKTGALLLRKPAVDVMLSNKYGRGIFVKKTEDSAWEQIDIKGKTIFKLDNANPETKPMANIGNIALIKDYKNIISIIDTNNGKTIWKKKYKNIEGATVAGNCFIIRDGDFKIYDIVSPTGEVVDSLRITDYRLITQDDVDNNGDIRFCNFKNYIQFENLHNSGCIKIYDVAAKKFFDDDLDMDGEIEKPIFFTSKIKIFKTYNGDYYRMDSNEIQGTIGTHSKDFIIGVCVINPNEEIYCVVDGESKKYILNCKTGEKLSPEFDAVAWGRADNDVYTLLLNTPEKTAVLYDTNGEAIGEPITLWDNPSNVGTRYIGQGCFLITGDNDNKCNIVKPDGKLMFKMPFTAMSSLGFSNEGIASIEAGRNTYFINTDGDVSRSVETLNERFKNDDDLPMINESIETKPVKAKTSKLDLAAYLID